MKRPLAYFSVVFVSVLFLLQCWNVSIIRQNPIEILTDGEKALSGLQQDDIIQICGTVKDYSYNNQYGQITTELILKDIQILPHNEDYSKEKSITQTGQTIIAYVNEQKNVIIGSRLILTGKLSFFKEATNPGEFNAEKYYNNRDVLFAVKKAQILQVGMTGNRIFQGNPVFNNLIQNLKEFRMQQESYLSELLPTGNATVMKAMLFGNKKELEEDIKNLYQNNGIAHILAISGLHISLLGMSVYRLLLYLPIPRWIVLFGSELFLLLYGCMVGFSASAFRAIFMFTLFLLSKVLKRSYDMLTAMAASAVIQLLIHPGYLFDCGFQLSYAAIMGIGILLPAVEELVDMLKNKYLKKGLSLFLPSLSVTLFTAPILIYHYYELSFFSIVLNFIVLPLMSPLLLSGIGMLGVANLVTGFGMLFAIPINAILWIFETGCKLLEMLPIGRKNIAPFSASVMIIYYMLLFGVTISVKQKRHVHQLIFIFVAMIILIIPRKPDFSVWMLDVGQGDCNVIFTEEGNCFVIDCGSTSKYNVGQKILIPFLKYHGVGRVDGVIITHPDADHMNGVLELLELGEEENISVAGVYLYEKGLENEPESWEELINLVEVQDIQVFGIGQGDILQTDSISMECIYPLKEQEGLTGNEASLVMKVECGDFQGLFTGDLEIEGERQILGEYTDLFDGETCDLLKVGHHGSSGSTSAEFLRWVSPDYAVISCGKNNSYGHPHEETLERLRDGEVLILTTPNYGAIHIYKEKNKLLVLE